VVREPHFIEGWNTKSVPELISETLFISVNNLMAERVGLD
jgi:hypothetical protein